MKGKGPCAPCRSRCRGGEQSEDEDESVHYESETQRLKGRGLIQTSDFDSLKLAINHTHIFNCKARLEKHTSDEDITKILPS